MIRRNHDPARWGVRVAPPAYRGTRPISELQKRRPRSALWSTDTPAPAGRDSSAFDERCELVELLVGSLLHEREHLLADRPDEVLGQVRLAVLLGQRDRDLPPAIPVPWVSQP